MTPDQAKKLDEIHTAVFGGRPNEIARQVWALPISGFATSTGSAADYMRRLVRAVEEDDLDAAEVAALVLASLTPAAIAAAIPDGLAADVVDELHRRTAPTSG